MLAGAGALAAVAAGLPTVALADANEDAMAAIAEKNRQALLKKKEDDKSRVKAQIKQSEETSGEKLKKIGLVAAGGTVLSVPFYYRNIIRLVTKIASRGEDDGYSSVPEPKKFGRGKKAPPPPPPEPEGFDVGKVGKAAKALFLGK